jgi:signal peptidase II
MKKENIFNFFFVIFIFLLDRLSKVILINKLANFDEVEYEITSFLSLNLIWNDGIAFGLLSLKDKFYYNLLSTIIIIVILIIFYLMIKSKGIEKYAYIMLLGGSLGNIFDRLFYSKVPDFIDLHFNNFNWFIFNVADIFITLGVILLIYLEFRKKKTYA